MQGRGRERGQALVEFALCASLFLMLVFSVFEAARMFQTWTTVQHAAREGARYAVTGRDECDGAALGRDDCIIETSRKATAGLTGGGSGSAAVTVSLTSWQHDNNYEGPGTPNDAGEQCDAVEVKVQYQYDPLIPFFKLLAPSGLNMAGSQRMVIEPYGPC